MDTHFVIMNSTLWLHFFYFLRFIKDIDKDKKLKSFIIYLILTLNNYKMNLTDQKRVLKKINNKLNYLSLIIKKLKNFFLKFLLIFLLFFQFQFFFLLINKRIKNSKRGKDKREEKKKKEDKIERFASINTLSSSLYN